MAKIIAVCSSEKKGTKKEVTSEGVLREDYGLVGDAHADCCTHRQVSLLALESIDKMRTRGLEVGPGDFAENLTTEGIDLVSLPLGTRISSEILLKIARRNIPILISKSAPTDLAVGLAAGLGITLIRCGDPINRPTVHGIRKSFLCLRCAQGNLENL